MHSNTSLLLCDNTIIILAPNNTFVAIPHYYTKFSLQAMTQIMETLRGHQLFQSQKAQQPAAACSPNLLHCFQPLCTAANNKQHLQAATVISHSNICPELPR